MGQNLVSIKIRSLMYLAIFLGLVLFVFISSCDITKRHYRRGYHLEWNHHKNTTGKQGKTLEKDFLLTKHFKQNVQKEVQENKDHKIPHLICNSSNSLTPEIFNKNKPQNILGIKSTLGPNRIQIKNRDSSKTHLMPEEENKINFGKLSLIFFALSILVGIIIAVLSINLVTYGQLFLLLLFGLIEVGLFIVGLVYSIAGLFYKEPSSCKRLSAIALILWIIVIIASIILL